MPLRERIVDTQTGQAVIDTLKNSNGNNPIAWSDIASTLERGRESYTLNWCQAVVYPENAACYAGGGSSCTLKPVQNDINDVDGDENTNEYAP